MTRESETEPDDGDERDAVIEVKPGDRVRSRTASGEWLPAVADSGHDVADAWDEGWNAATSPRPNINPYRLRLIESPGKMRHDRPM